MTETDPPLTIEQAIAERDEALAEVARLEGILAGDATLVHTSYSEGSPLEVSLRHPLVKAMAASMRSVLDSCDAQNYVEAQLHDVQHEPPEVFVMTIQRKGGQTPVQQRKAAEAERDEARRQLEHANALICKHLVYEGTCSESDDDSAYCDDGACTYCKLARYADTHCEAMPAERLVEPIVRDLLDGASTWAGDLGVVPAEPLRMLASMLGKDIDQNDDVPPVLVQRDGLPEAHRIERASFCGLLRDQWATLWCRENSPAPAGSPVPWSTTEAHPWTVEIHLRTAELDGDGYGSTAFAVPCPVDPRVPSPEADAAIALAVLRASIHEAQEGLLLDGVRVLDPHERGEIGLAALGQDVGAACV